MTPAPGPACDTHIHVYDAAFPVAAAASLRPADHGVADYAAFRDELGLGLDRVVVVQPTTYGLDNRCQLAAMAEFGDRARGVMVVDATTSSAEIARLDALGVRGARFHMLPGGAVGWEHLEPVAEAIAPFGWHIQLQLDGRELPRHLDRLRRLPVGLVVDHVGRFMPPVEPEHPAFAALVALVDEGAWVKLSAPYESAPDPTHAYGEVGLLVDELVATAPDRLLWASNWPHPGQVDPPSPEQLADLFRRWVTDPAIAEQIMVRNPARLYGF